MNDIYKTIREIPKENRPYEKCLRIGAQALTDEELLAIVIRTGTNGESSYTLANKILSFKGDRNLTNLFHMSINELCQIKGVGKVKAVQIQCICELSRRISMTQASKLLDFNKPVTVATYYMESMRHSEVEQMIVVFLDNKSRKITDKIMFSGTVNKSLASPREIFIEALKCNAVNIILLHNHPSGDATPSRDDMIATQRIKEAGNLIGINLLDHIVLGDKRYTSFKETGIL